MPTEYAIYLRRYTDSGEVQVRYSRWVESRNRIEWMAEHVWNNLTGTDTDVGSVVVLDRAGNQVWEMEV